MTLGELAFSNAVEIAKDLKDINNGDINTLHKWFEYFIESGEMPLSTVLCEDTTEWIINQLGSMLEDLLLLLDIDVIDDETIDSIYGE
tara:strand:+ start:5287 stop:5550 length:264 start_codon:yes stop_codon:yes gene_type:complete